MIRQIHFTNFPKTTKLLARTVNTLPLNKIKNETVPEILHSPVMLKEVIDLLNPQPNQNILDMTFGAGGHSREILRRCPQVNLFALDRDPLAFNLATNLSKENPQIKPMLGSFSEAETLLKTSYGVNSVHGVILDAGVSSMQFSEGSRGFSINKDGPLDMRMDQNQNKSQVTAYDVVNHMSETNLFDVLRKYGEEKNSRSIARAIVDHRYSTGAIRSTCELADVVSSAFLGEAQRRDKLDRHAHLATKTFQAIRIFVNDELNELNTAMDAVHRLLVPGGVCVAISFHSLEDRIIKRHFHGISMKEELNESLRDKRSRILELEEMKKLLKKKWNVVVKRVTTPSDEEISNNPRSRSAKMRYAYKEVDNQ